MSLRPSLASLKPKVQAYCAQSSSSKRMAFTCDTQPPQICPRHTERPPTEWSSVRTSDHAEEPRSCGNRSLLPTSFLTRTGRILETRLRRLVCVRLGRVQSCRTIPGYWVRLVCITGKGDIPN